MDWQLFLVIAFVTVVSIFGKRPRQRWLHPKKRATVHVAPTHDSADQLRAVTGAGFKARKLMSRDEARVFYAAERAVKSAGTKHRVMAQVNLGEILSCSDKRAFRAVNSKRVDILIVSHFGDPVAAIEYQGQGHYQADAPARDAVKREALRQAGVAYLEIAPGDDEQRVQELVQRVLSSDTSSRRAA